MHGGTQAVACSHSRGPDQRRTVTPADQAAADAAAAAAEAAGAAAEAAPTAAAAAPSAAAAADNAARDVNRLWPGPATAACSGADNN